MASLKRIAEDLGISYSLVSKVLNGRLGTSGVSKEMRTAIFQRAKELDYSPNRLAVALKKGRTGNIGVFIHRIGTPGTELNEQLLLGVSDVLSQNGYRTWLRFFLTEEEFLEACDERIEREVDGLIVAGVPHPQLGELLLRLNNANCPVVATFPEHTQIPGLTNVNVDNEEQGYLTARHLLEQGCKRLVLFRCGRQPRYQGFLRAHRDLEVPVRKELVVDLKGFTQSGAQAAIRSVQKKGHSFDGVATQADSQALGVIRELLSQGISVPDDVLVTGVDDSPLAEASFVPITSASSEMATSGRKAAVSLIEQIEGAPSRLVVIQPRLVVRRSSTKAV